MINAAKTQEPSKLNSIVRPTATNDTKGNGAVHRTFFQPGALAVLFCEM